MGVEGIFIANHWTATEAAHFQDETDERKEVWLVGLETTIADQLRNQTIDQDLADGLRKAIQLIRTNGYREAESLRKLLTFERQQTRLDSQTE